MKPLRTETAWSTPWFEVAAKTMREGEDPYYSLRLPDYAAVVAVTMEGRIVIVRQYRPAIEQYTLELPSGLIDPGETPAEAARRELMEETGFDAPPVEVLGAMAPDTGRLGNRIFACFVNGVRLANRTPEEGIQVRTWSPTELRAAITEGRFGHALHVAVVMMAVLQGRIVL